MKTILLLFGISQIVYSQQISGIVKDSLSNKAIPYATVYLDGTTIGTVTDSEGHFALANVIFPSTLIVSHTSYYRKVTDLVNSSSNLEFLLKEKNIDISEITIEDINNREKNIKRFKNAFIGSNYLGSHTILLNDSLLIFNCKYEDAGSKIDSYSKVSEPDDHMNPLATKIKSLKQFDVTAIAPLMLDMPLLGYTLQIDLEEFCILYSGKYTKSLFQCYTYFQPYSDQNRFFAPNYEKNRQKAYYHSRQHFCRSFISNSLEQNGYMVIEDMNDVPNNEIDSPSNKYVLLDTCIHQVNNDLFAVIGLANRKFKIIYHQKRNGHPKDLTNKKDLDEIPSEAFTLDLTNTTRNDIKISDLYFLKDTCYITSSGTIPGYEIMFGGDISIKKVGSMLPSDYSIDNP